MKESIISEVYSYPTEVYSRDNIITLVSSSSSGGISPGGRLVGEFESYVANASYSRNLYIAVAGITIGQYTGKNTSYVRQTFSLPTTAGDTVVIQARSLNANSYYKNLKFYYIQTYMDQSKIKYKLYPREVKTIGEVGFTTLYGVGIEEDFIGIVPLGESTSCSTGSITLPNAQGYLIMNVNGNIVKIPYYNE